MLPILLLFANRTIVYQSEQYDILYRILGVNSHNYVTNNNYIYSASPFLCPYLCYNIFTMLHNSP